MSEVYITPFERGFSGHTKLSTFVSIPISSFLFWFETTIDQELKWLEAVSFLAVILAVERHGEALKSQIKNYVKIDTGTLSKNLEKLRQGGLINSSIHKPETMGKPLEYFDYHPSDQSHHYLTLANPKDAYFTDINPLATFDELDWVPYAPWRPPEIKNPLVSINGSMIEIHERTLEATILMAALLSRGQLRDWLKVAHGNSYRNNFATIKKRITSIINDKMTVPTIHHLHYRQISHALPVVMYAARRTFTSDPARTILLAKLTREDIRFAWDNAIMSWEALDNVILLKHPRQRGKLNWDFRYFLTCFLRINPYSHWKVKYPNVNPSLPRIKTSTPGTKHEWVEITEKQFSLGSIENLSTQISLGVDILRVVQLFNNRRVLRSLKKNTYLAGSDSPRALTQTFDNASHRMYMINAPRQGIPKSIRSIFKSRPMHHFLMIDIIQNDMSVWEALAKEQDSTLDDTSFADFTNVSQHLSLSRDSIKQATYSFFYGASQKRILLESGFSRHQWEKVKKALGLSHFIPVKRAIMHYVDKEGTTPPTPHLYYRIPINKKLYRAPALFVQAIGAEIMREWILNLKEINLGVFIVNLIHDEIIFELPQDFNLWESVEDIDNCLQIAAKKILPLANLRIRASASKRWDQENAIMIKG